MNDDDDYDSYQFVGSCGLFCPIKPGCGGGKLLRKSEDGKYSSVTGTKNYYWLESEVVQNLHKEDDIDLNYFRHLVDDAIDTIAKFGDAEMFIYGKE